jgi:hypothetical protein
MTTTSTTTDIPRAASPVARLRRIMPRRPLSFGDAKRVGELQATTLLQMYDVRLGRVSETLIAQLPWVDVQYREGLISSGLTTWERGAWRIAINRDEPSVRRRFTLAHELKHVLDASHEDVIYRHLPNGPARDRHIEAVCDHFAACLLMPRPWVKRLWGEGIQNLAVLARHFDVSQQAMLIRLQNLGLVEPLPRCLPAIGRVALSGVAAPGRHSRPRTTPRQHSRTPQTYWRAAHPLARSRIAGRSVPRLARAMAGR